MGRDEAGNRLGALQNKVQRLQDEVQRLQTEVRRLQNEVPTVENEITYLDKVIKDTKDFRSATGPLGANLAASILQFAMCDGEARALPTGTFLSRLYTENKAGYQLLPGVLVTGAEVAECNGWYHRRENEEGPPEAYQASGKCEWWEQCTRGRQWYLNNNGCYMTPILHPNLPPQWRCRSSDNITRYGTKISEDMANTALPSTPPPTDRWYLCGLTYTMSCCSWTNCPDCSGSRGTVRTRPLRRRGWPVGQDEAGDECETCNGTGGITEVPELSFQLQVFTES